MTANAQDPDTGSASKQADYTKKTTYTGFPVSYESLPASGLTSVHESPSYMRRVESQVFEDATDSPEHDPANSPADESGVTPTTIGWIVRRCGLKRWAPEESSDLPIWDPALRPLLPSCEPSATEGSRGDNLFDLPQSWIDFYCRNRIYFNIGYAISVLIIVGVLYFTGKDELLAQLARAFLCYIGLVPEVCPGRTRPSV
ncbi:unnamed protein product [Kuraishia capsulata CBS 1993]|uniref:Uncharacterized protein n=1 Tax=Kuraishia capsulata CBS 1993 TaxID=1382522 RepID=W6MY28_9ASCO|nr:uncharacterized protein KUCA_T00005904001 [Kuraishia capsulata CBS 1993]CDK29910.1 unnamed protein product [Kuraishia capsulata CBS 1993]